MISGYATPAGTQRYAQRNDGLTYNLLAQTGLSISQAGFGSYRISQQSDQHRTALSTALQSGINLIDTSANYGDGSAERLIGQVLDELIRSDELQRDEVVLVSKAGYLQGENLAISQERKQAGTPFPDLIEYMQGLEHCIHPEFLRDQLTRTLARLNCDSLDIYLLHNPEYYLSWAKRSGIDLTSARQEYYRRLEMALLHLESEVNAGRIRSYGISSNTFPSLANDPEFTSLQQILEIVDRKELKSFTCLQLPANLLETGMVTNINQPDGQSVLQLAAQHKLAILVNRPLNAIVADALFRLASVPPAERPDHSNVSTAVDTLAKLELVFESEILPSLLLGAQEKERVPALVATGRILEQRWSSFGNWQQWQDVQFSVLIPRLRAVAEMLLKRRNLAPAAHEWLESYGRQAEWALELISRHYQATSAQMAQKLHNGVKAADTVWAAPTLSQSAIRALRSTSGVSCVLVGARQTAYVSDVVRELYRPVEQAERLGGWQRLAAFSRELSAGNS